MSGGTRVVIVLVTAAVAFGVAGGGAALGSQIEVSVQQVTGTAPFDSTAGSGMDTSQTDAVVRANDTLTYNVTVTVPGSSANINNLTIVQSLPTGLEWGPLPGFCNGPGSGVSGPTITCVVGPLAAGAIQFWPLQATAAQVADGTVLTPAADSVSVTGALAGGGSTSATATPAPVTVTGKSSIDFVNDRPKVTFVAASGGHPAGAVLSYPILQRLTEMNTRELRGYIAPVQPLSFVDEFSGVSPSAELFTWGGIPACQGDGADPGVFNFGGYPKSDGGGDNGVTRTGTWTCTSLGGGRAQVTISNADLSAEHTPFNADFSGTIPADLGYVGVGEVSVFVPTSDLGAGKNLKSVAENAPVGSLSMQYQDYTSPTVWPPGQSAAHSGDSEVVAGQIVQGEIGIGSNGSSPLIGVIACNVFDHTVMTASSQGSVAASFGTRPAFPHFTNVVEGTDYVIEYGTGPTSTAADPTTRWKALRDANCDGDASSPDHWSTPPPADLGTVTKVRVRFIAPYVPGRGLYFDVNLKVLADNPGDILPIFGSWKADNANGGEFAAHVRFEGCSFFASDGSNNGPGVPGRGCTGPFQTPEPGTLALLGLSIAGIGYARSRAQRR